MIKMVVMKIKGFFLFFFSSHKGFFGVFYSQETSKESASMRDSTMARAFLVVTSGNEGLGRGLLIDETVLAVKSEAFLA